MARPVETRAATAERARVTRIIRILWQEYPDATTSLDFKNPFQLLVATILSAQCTDERVNRITPSLFKRFPGPKEMAEAKLGELQSLIQSSGFFRAKALAIRDSSRLIIERHGGEVPRTMEKLVMLRGVGRKTANVILGNAFGVPGLPVDTHVTRLAFRLGLTVSKNPERIERDLMAIVPREEWVDFSHLLIFHGRKICTARKPQCPICPIRDECPRIGV